jgi:hypothetical protein
MNQIQRHSGELINNDYGTCGIKFILGIDGKVTNLEATSMQDTNLAKIAVQNIQSVPKWRSGMQHGRPISAYRKQPVTRTNPN